MGFTGPGWYDSIYCKVSGGITFSHTSSSLSLSFQGFSNEPLDNESWGIDNVRIITDAVVPEPCTIGLLFFGFLAMLKNLKKK
ncbi:MAG: PEP-CTERM sorting domain-containing protein [Candidatus Brocadiae bacterium]|nr:PEP-CTERM sorting domain-containing protein [Candidatus Brocadiia bacterium]